MEYNYLYLKRMFICRKMMYYSVKNISLVRNNNLGAFNLKFNDNLTELDLLNNYKLQIVESIPMQTALSTGNNLYSYHNKLKLSFKNNLFKEKITTRVNTTVGNSKIRNTFNLFLKSALIPNKNKKSLEFSIKRNILYSMLRLKNFNCNNLFFVKVVDKNKTKSREGIKLFNFLQNKPSIGFNFKIKSNKINIKFNKFLLVPLIKSREKFNSELKNFNFSIEKKHFGLNSKNREIYNSISNYYSYLFQQKSFPSMIYMNHLLFYGNGSKIKIKTKNSKLISKYYQRHFSSILNSRLTILRTSIGSRFFANWKIKVIFESKFKQLMRVLWRFFKLKIERFFFKMLGVRSHVWFLSIWQIFITGIPNRNSWEYFEAKKIVEYTRRGHRYVIENAEDARFFIRIMVVMFTFVGGLKLFLERIAEWMADFRNHWAYVKFIAETMRKCANFFWFRFFLNYRISLQGKVGGQLRAQKKIFNRGTISIENWSSMIGYHKAYANTKFGVFNLSLWMQFKVPPIVESFEGHQLVSTMQVLLSRYSIPWLGRRLAYVLFAIERDERAKRAFSKKPQKNKKLFKDLQKKTKKNLSLNSVQYKIKKRKEIQKKTKTTRNRVFS